MRILIATGIYPPQTSGPAQYAYNMKQEWSKMGHDVEVKIFGKFQRIPWGLRHIIFFFYIIPSVVRSDYVFALDAFSAGVVTVVSKLFSKKIIFRTGGDALWELYVERTGDLVLLSDFYKTRLHNFNFKEKVIFNLMKWALKNVNLLVFSTEWQRSIFLEPYNLDIKKTNVIENHYEKSNDLLSKNTATNKNFVSGARPLKWKNLSFLKGVFEDIKIKQSGAVLDTSMAGYDKFMEKISNSYAVILVSLGDISPHMILDAISLNKPFILTKENGLMNRVKDVAIVIDPKSAQDIKEKVLWLMDENNYKGQVEKIKSFSFVRTWNDIAEEYITIFKSI